MSIEIVNNKEVLFDYLQKEAGIQIYLTGDLDDFFWPDTIWYALKEGQEIKAVALLYTGMKPPTLLCFQKEGYEFAIRLLNEIRHLLPTLFYAHLGEGFADVFERRNIVEHYGLNYKMVLQKKVNDPGDNNIRRLNSFDLPEILKLYSIAYLHNWFDSRMLESGKYFGYFAGIELAGIAGIHVYSAKYKVAALGNIATHPAYRQQHIGYKLSAALCCDLQQTVDVIGLNVRSDNEYAIRLYKNLGFEIAGVYEECLIRNEPTV
jgi:ribosomal protein S18 acetylase RimI-like enzyme